MTSSYMPCNLVNLKTKHNPCIMGTLTNSEDPDEMPYNMGHIMQHFIRVYTVKKRSSDQKKQYFSKIIPGHP